MGKERGASKGEVIYYKIFLRNQYYLCEWQQEFFVLGVVFFRRIEVIFEKICGRYLYLVRMGEIKIIVVLLQCYFCLENYKCICKMWLVFGQVVNKYNKFWFKYVSLYIWGRECLVFFGVFQMMVINNIMF